MPISIVGSLGVIYLLGYSLDNLSLMAMTIATGFVVDDAIVVIENISRYIEKGEDRYTAAIKGSQEIGFTIISLTVSLIAVLFRFFHGGCGRTAFPRIRGNAGGDKSPLRRGRGDAHTINVRPPPHEKAP